MNHKIPGDGAEQEGSLSERGGGTMSGVPRRKGKKHS